MPISAPLVGGFTFAEHPERPACLARIMWCEAVDPGVLHAEAIAPGPDGQGAIDLLQIPGFRVTVARSDIAELVVIDDGLRRLRLDILDGTVLAGPVRLRFIIEGPYGADPPARTLRRLLAAVRHGRLLDSHYPRDARMERWLLALRVHDALTDGATYREIAIGLYGADRVARAWRGPSDALQSRVRRIAALARRLAAGDYLQLLRIR